MIVFLAVVCFPSSGALATSGWENYDTRVGKFRIQGRWGASWVHRIDATGAVIEPALCSNLGANGEGIGLGCPPDYALTKTHLAIRYPVSATNPLPNHYLIRIEDGQVTGPLTDTEFEESPLVSQAELRWRTPLTAGDQWKRFWTAFATGASLWLLGVAVVLAVVLYFSGVAIIRGFRRIRPQSPTKPQLPPKDPTGKLGERSWRRGSLS